MYFNIQTIVQCIIGAWTFHIAIDGVQRYSNGLDVYDHSSISAGVWSVVFPSMPTLPQLVITNKQDTSSPDQEGRSRNGTQHQSFTNDSEPLAYVSRHNTSPDDTHTGLNTAKPGDMTIRDTRQASLPPPSPVDSLLHLLTVAAYHMLNIYDLLNKVAPFIAFGLWYYITRKLAASEKSLREKCDELDAIQRASASLVVDVSAQLDQADTQLQQALADNNNLRSQAGNNQTALSTLSRDLNASRLATETANGRADRLRAELQTANEEQGSVGDLLKESRDALRLALERADGHETEVRDLRTTHADTISSLDKKLTASEKATTDATGEVESLKVELGNAQRVVKDTSSKVRGLEADLATSRSTVEAANGKVRQRQADLTSSRQAVETARGRIQELEASATDVSRDLESTTEQVAKLEADLGGLRQDNRAATGRTEELGRELAEASSKTSSLESELEKSRRETRAALASVEDWKNLRNKAQSASIPLKARADLAEKAAEVANGKAETMKKMVTRLEEELKQAKSSASSSARSAKLDLERSQALLTTARTELAHGRQDKKDLEASLDKTVRCTVCQEMLGLEAKFEGLEVEVESSSEHTPFAGQTLLRAAEASPEAESSAASAPPPTSPPPPPQQLSAAAAPFSPSPMPTPLSQETAPSTLVQSLAPPRPPPAPKRPSAMTPAIEPHHQAYQAANLVAAPTPATTPSSPSAGAQQAHQSSPAPTGPSRSSGPHSQPAASTQEAPSSSASTSRQSRQAARQAPAHQPRARPTASESFQAFQRQFGSQVQPAPSTPGPVASTSAGLQPQAGTQAPAQGGSGRGRGQGQTARHARDATSAQAHKDAWERMQRMMARK